MTMTGDETIKMAASGARLRLSTLVRLRWLAIGGQSAAVLIVAYWFGFSLPALSCFGLIALSAIVNVALRVRFAGARLLDPVWATIVLGYDILQLAGLLYLTGGLQNPFSVLLLVPVMVAATALEPDKTFLLGGLVMTAASVLVFRHWPLPWYPDESVHLPLLYLAGTWIGLACALVFMAFYAFRVSREARQLSDALTATELVLQREQHLSALDGLAAAAAHELGTPLATISLVARELERELQTDDAHGDDIRLLRSQSERCRDILSKLTSLSAQPEGHLGRMPLSHILEDVVAPHRDFGVTLRYRTWGDGPEPVAERNPGLLYGLGNIVENAVDFAKSNVSVDATWNADTVTVTVTDDGPGFAPDIIDRIGEPYVTTRRTSGPATGADGLGLGFFIAKTLLERSGAAVSLANLKAPGSGARIAITWSREAFDIEPAPSRAPARAPV